MKARWAQAKSISSSLGVLLAVVLGATPAHAVFLEADAIEADGAFSTVDLWFFEFDADVTATIQVDDLGGPPVVGADPDMIIYVDDGTFSSVFAMDTALGSDPSISMMFTAGSYVAVVANHELTVGEFGPSMVDLALAVGGYMYEFNGPEPIGGDITINCLLSGNLGGGFTRTVFSSDTCVLPPISATEPSVLALILAGLLGLAAGARRWRST